MIAEMPFTIIYSNVQITDVLPCLLEKNIDINAYPKSKLHNDPSLKFEIFLSVFQIIILMFLYVVVITKFALMTTIT